MKRIALKIDVDTYPGARYAVFRHSATNSHPRQQASTPRFSSPFGPDYSGCENRQSPARYYPFQSRLYGRYWPTPEIGKACAEVLRGVATAGFRKPASTSWNRVFWERKIGQDDVGGPRTTSSAPAPATPNCSPTSRRHTPLPAG